MKQHILCQLELISAHTEMCLGELAIDDEAGFVELDEVQKQLERLIQRVKQSREDLYTKP